MISWNGGAEALYGWTREEAVGRNARELMVPEDTAEAERLLVELSRDGRWDGELKVRRKDGTRFTAYVRNRLVLDRDGAPSAIVGVAVDISARVAAETELLQSRNYAQAVTECMGEGLFTLDVEGRITYVNRVAEELLGAARDELRGREVGAAVLAPARAASAGASRTARLRGRCAAGPCAWTKTFRAARRPRDARRLHRDPVPDADGVQGCVVIFQDTSERRAAKRRAGATPRRSR